jgi:hypothetical protein
MPTPHIDENVLDRYAMGTLPEAAIPPVEEHLLSCSVCQSRLVETDDFLIHFRAAATQVELQTAPFWQRFLNTQRLIWGGSLVAAAALALLLVTGEPRLSKPQPAMVRMQSLRGPEEQAQIAKGSPSLLIFDLPIPATHPTYEVEVVDTAGKQILKGQGIVKDDRLAFLIQKLAPAGYWVRIYEKQPARTLVAEYGLEAK